MMIEMLAPDVRPAEQCSLYSKARGQRLILAQAFGNAAMILASGKKGNRFALPHSRIMTAPPRINRSFGSTSNIMIKANELEYNTQTYVDFLSKYTGEHSHFKPHTTSSVPSPDFPYPKKAQEMNSDVEICVECCPSTLMSPVM